jgi:stage V sporulation protein G
MLFNIDYYEAAVKLSRDFGITAEKSNDNKIYIPKRNIYQSQSNLIQEAFSLIADYRDYLNYCKHKYKPQSVGEKHENLSPQFVEALENLERCEYYLDFMISNKRTEQLQFIFDNEDLLHRIALKVQEYKSIKPAEYERSAIFITGGNVMNWNDKIGQEFHLKGEGDGFPKYTLLDVNDDDSITLRREDGWTFNAVLPELNEDGTIEWAYSSKGQFANEVTANPVHQEYPAVYMNSIKQAADNGEKDLWIQSNELNREYLAAFVKAIDDNSRSGEMAGTQYVDTPKALEEVMQKYGAERVCTVSAVQIERMDYDGRISQANKLWASGISKPDDMASSLPFINTHATILDSFFNKVREACDKAQNRLFDEKGYCSLSEIYAGVNAEYAIHVNQEKDNSITIAEGKQMPNVNIKATAYLVGNGGKLKANAIVSVNDSMVVRNIKVVEGERGLRIDMPGRKIGDKWQDSVKPASIEAAAQIKRAVVEAYEKAVELARNGGELIKPALARKDIDVEVWSIRDNIGNNRSFATCSVKVADTFIINDVQIKEGGELGLKVSLPGIFGSDGEWYDTVSVYSSVVRDSVLEAYIAREQDKQNIIGNTDFRDLFESPDNRDDVKYKTFSGDLAAKVGAELDKAGVKWSGKIDRENESTTFVFNVRDEMKVNKAVQNAKSPTKAISKFQANLNAKKAQANQNNANRINHEMQNKPKKSRAEEL